MSDEEPKGGGFTVRDPEGGDAEGLPSVDFSTFVLSMAASAMVRLGLAPAPEGVEGAPAGGKPGDADLALARQTIETLAMLQEKTRGNLEDEERKLFESVLYELRMAYVKARG